MLKRVVMLRYDTLVYSLGHTITSRYVRLGYAICLTGRGEADQLGQPGRLRGGASRTEIVRSEAELMIS